MIKVERVTEKEDLDVVFAIRKKVFVEEQSCPPELEWEFEEESTHFLATYNDIPAAAARWRQTEKGFKLERFAVLQEYRGKGVGQMLLKAVLQDLPHNANYIYLHAQVQAMGLYLKMGFVAEGPQFEEAGIQHYKMTLKR